MGHGLYTFHVLPIECIHSTGVSRGMCTFNDLHVECIHSTLDPLNVYIPQLSTFNATYTQVDGMGRYNECMQTTLSDRTRGGHILWIYIQDPREMLMIASFCTDGEIYIIYI